MILMLLLTELVRLDVQVSEEQGRLRIEAPAGALSDELRQAMAEHKVALLQFAASPYVETIDGLGVLTGNKQEQDMAFVAPERQEAARYKIGVLLLHNEQEQFYWPRMVLIARPETIQTDEHLQEATQ